MSNSPIISRPADSVNHILVERAADHGITQYTAVQCFMALDLWTAANADFESAADEFDSIVRDPMRAKFDNHSLALIWACRTDAEFSRIDTAEFKATENLDGQCPLTHKMRNHSKEAYPVDKTLRSAAKLRTAAKKTRVLTAEWDRIMDSRYDQHNAEQEHRHNEALDAAEAVSHE